MLRKSKGLSKNIVLAVTLILLLIFSALMTRFVLAQDASTSAVVVSSTVSPTPNISEQIKERIQHLLSPAPTASAEPTITMSPSVTPLPVIPTAAPSITIKPSPLPSTTVVNSARADGADGGVDAEETQVNEYCFHTLAPGQVMFLKAFCRVKGDIEVARVQNGPYQPLYDSNTSTGLVVSLKEDAWIKAPWGASTSYRSAEELIAEGCGPGCTVKHVEWPGSVNEQCNQSIQPGQAVAVQAGCNVKGDIEASSNQSGPFEKLYDSDSSTGLVVTFSENGWVKAPFGAVISSASVETLIGQGCGPGCTVKAIQWPGEAQDMGTMIPPGTGIRKFKKNTVIAGDIKVVTTGTDEALYDNDPKTGLVVLLKDDADVVAEYGGTYYEHSDLESARATMNRVAQEMKLKGCGGGCNSVRTFEWFNRIGVFRDLSANLRIDRATFNFTYTGASDYYRITLLTGEPAPYNEIEVWWGQSSPAVVNRSDIPTTFYAGIDANGNPRILPFEYKCGSQISWRVHSQFNSSETIKSTVQCQ